MHYYDVAVYICGAECKVMKKQQPQKPIDRVSKYDDDLHLLYCPACKWPVGSESARWPGKRMYNASDKSVCLHCGAKMEVD